MYQNLCTCFSVGHLVVDSLAARLGVRMTADRSMGGYIGHGNITLEGTVVSLTLFKSSMSLESKRELT
jgi:peptidyl-tRNA hydrolase, PTH1 family